MISDSFHIGQGSSYHQYIISLTIAKTATVLFNTPMENHARSVGPLYLGIDGGGSKCRAFVTNDSGSIAGYGLSTSANPSHGFDETIKAIMEAAVFALKDAGLPSADISTLQVGAGLAGINLPHYFNQMQQWKHPFKTLFLTSDVHIACLGAHQGSDGSVLVVGTGSCGLIQYEGATTMLGGHGFPYGDQASGAWIGLKVVEAVLLAHDELAPPTQLTDKIDDYLKLNGEILVLRDLMIAKPSRVYASLAPLTFDLYQDDIIATQVVNEGVDYLNKLAKKLLTYPKNRLALVGGLAHRYQPLLCEDVQVNVTSPLASPEQGAVLFVKQQSYI